MSSKFIHLFVFLLQIIGNISFDAIKIIAKSACSISLRRGYEQAIISNHLILHILIADLHFIETAI